MGETRQLRQPVECVIEVEGREIGELYPLLRRVTVEGGRKGAAVAALSFDSVRDRDGKWRVQDSGVFLPWRRVRIEAAFGAYREEVLRGYVREIAADYPADMAATVTVTCQDESLVLDREQMAMVHSTADQKLKDGEIVKRLAAPHSFAVDAADGLENGSLNYSGTPVRLLQERARANGYEFLVRQGKLYFGPPRLEGDPQPPIMVYAGDASNCLSFAVKHDGHLPDQVRLLSAPDTGSAAVSETFSPALARLGKSAAESTGSGLPPFVWNLERATGATAAERRARAQAKADESSWKLQAEGELDGALYGHVLYSHATVTVDGVGETYGGVWYVDEVKHEFSAEGYRQNFRLIRNATGEQPPAASADPLARVRLR